MISELRKGDIVRLTKDGRYLYKVLEVLGSIIFISHGDNHKEYNFTTNLERLNKTYPNASIVERDLEIGETYYFITTNGDICDDKWLFEDFNGSKGRHAIRKNTNNVFRTKKEAETRLKELLK